MKTKLLWAFAGLLLTIIFGLGWAPYYIKSYVQGHYPGVKVGAVKLTFSGVIFSRVSVNRDGITADLIKVFADWSKNVAIHGGTVNVVVTDLPKAAERRSSRLGRVTGDGLSINVQKDGNQANLTDASFDDVEVRFGSSRVLYDGHTVTFGSGSVTRDRKIFNAASVEAPIVIPIALPNVEPKQTLRATGITVNIDKRLVEFDTASMAPIFSVKGHSKLQALPTAFRLDLSQLEVNHPWVSPDPATFDTVSVKAPKTLATIEIGLGPTTITVEPKTFHIQGKDTCNNWIAAMPSPLPLALEQAKGNFKGTLSFEVVKDPAPQIKVSNDCRYICSMEPIKSIKSGRFTYMAYDKNDKLFAREVGPQAPNWTSLASLPGVVPKAFITLEDPGFENHRGILVQALQNSFEANVQLGKFFRGGSTITMQLAKNLWLRRHKTIGRKTQEALLTLALESCLTKDEILQLYLNVVEFGPNLYGIGPAAKHYFDKDPAKLEAVEAFYLASIMPNPRSAVIPGEAGLNRIRSLMVTLAGRGYISDQFSVQDTDGWDAE